MALQGAIPWEHQDGQLATADIIKGLAEGKVVASDIGATVLGITESNVRQYLLELMYAVVAGQLPASKFIVGLKASGVSMEAQTPNMLVQLLWIVWTQLTFRETGTEQNKSNLIDLTKELEKAHLMNKDILVMNSDRFFLEEVGTITKAEVLRKKEVQINTRIHYAQKRFNLLREESEGFAKLLEALLRFEEAAMEPAHVKALVKEAQALIGFFDLDPKRVYDLVLETYEQMPDQAAFLQLTALFSQDARTQILGFRFTRIANDKGAQSDALYRITAQLIKAGQVRLEALLPHVGPSAEETQAAYAEAVKQLEASVKTLGFVNLNEDSSKSKDVRVQKVGLTAAKLELDARPLNETFLGTALRGNQFFGLTAALLEAGNWENGSQMLNHLMKLGVDPVAYPPIAKALCKMARDLVAPTYNGLYPDGLRGQCILSRKDGGCKVIVPPLSEEAVSMLLLLGMHAYHDPQLLTQLARIFRHITLANTVLFASPDTMGEAYQRSVMMEQLLVDCLLPAMCMVPALAALANEVWGAVNLLSCTDRWRIYTALRAKIDATPLLEAASKMAFLETKQVLKRLNNPDKDKDKREMRRELAPMARLLGKASHAQPLTVCKTIIDQAVSYREMAESIVDALTYLDALSFDILSFLIIERLATSGHPKIKEDGINISDWLQALCRFTGRACLLCDRMDVNAICQYVADTLKQAETHDLLMLMSIIKKMTGVSLVSDVNVDQIEALAGGHLLQKRVFNQENDTRQITARMLSRATQRLASALQQGSPEEQLALPLLVMLAQQRRYIAVQTQKGPLKLISDLCDKALESLYLYGEFLSSSLSPEAYRKILPPISDLVHKFHLDIEVALQAHRPLLRELAPPQAAHEVSLPNGTVDMDDGEAEEGELEEGEAAQEPKDTAMPDADAEEAAAAETDPAGASGTTTATEMPAEEDGNVWHEAVADIRAALPANVWDSISPEFYMAFWSLRYNDIFVPTERYAREHQDLKDQIKRNEDQVALLEKLAQDLQYGFMGGHQGGGAYGGGYQGGGGFQGKELDVSLDVVLDDIEILKGSIRDRKETLRQMPGELAAQEQHVREMDKVLRARKGLWKCERRSMVRAYVQHCILPRATYSPADAAFCAAFMQRLVRMSVPWFPALLYLDTVMKQLIYLIPSCTDREALNLAVFFHETFIIMERWRGSETVFNKECVPNPCCSTSASSGSGPAPKFSDFKRLCGKWQHSIVAALRVALLSKEYMQTRNALLFLSYNSQVFPTMQRSGDELKQAAAAVIEQTDQEDLRTMANAYASTLDAEIKKAGRMLTEEEYNGVPPRRPASAGARADASSGKAASTASAAKDAKKGEGKPEAAAAAMTARDSARQQPADMEIEAGEVDAKKGTLLRPDAPEFKPVKETTGAPAPATTAASSKRKEAEQPASAQAKDQDRKRVSNKGERASKRLRTSDVEAGELEGSPAAASKPPVAPEQRPRGEEQRMQPERQPSGRHQPESSRVERKPSEREADRMARREERFADKAAAATHAKSTEPGEFLEPEGRGKRSSDTGGKKVHAPAPDRAEDGRASREHRPKDRDAAQHKDREAAPADRTRPARQAPSKEELSEQPPRRPSQNGGPEAGHHREKEAEHKDRSAVRSSQKPAAKARHRPAAEDPKLKKPTMGLDELREQALSSRRPAAKLEEAVAAAGNKKEPSSAPVRASSRRGAEPGHSDRAAQAAPVKPAEAKAEAPPKMIRTAVAERAGSAPKADVSPRPRQDLAKQWQERSKADAEGDKAQKGRVFSRLGIPIKPESASPRGRGGSGKPVADVPVDAPAKAEPSPAQADEADHPDANGTKAKKDKKSKKEKKDKKKRKEREAAEGEDDDADEMASMRSGKSGKKDKKDRKAKKAKESL